MRGSSYCPAHARAARWVGAKAHEHQALYNAAWRRARKAYLAQHPLCMCGDCQAGAKRIRVASVVDHIKPHRGDIVLFWDKRNWQSMAKPCHDRKTARGE